MPKTAKVETMEMIASVISNWIREKPRSCCHDLLALIWFRLISFSIGRLRLEEWFIHDSHRHKGPVLVEAVQQPYHLPLIGKLHGNSPMLIQVAERSVTFSDKM
jgi:hypothetical protein